MNLFCYETMPSEDQLITHEEHEFQQTLTYYGITNFHCFQRKPNIIYTGFVDSYFNYTISRPQKCFLKFCVEEEQRITTLLSYLQFEDFVVAPERVVEIFPCTLPNPPTKLLVLKCYDGSLEDLLQINTFPETEFTYICDSILKGIEFIHNAGIIHCDLKSSNIFIDKQYNNYVIGDFGISCTLEAAKKGKISFTRISTAWREHYHIPRKLFVFVDKPFGYEVDLFSYVTLILQIYNTLSIRYSNSLSNVETKIQLDFNSPKLLQNKKINSDYYNAIKILITKIRCHINNATYNVDYIQFCVTYIIASLYK